MPAPAGGEPAASAGPVMGLPPPGTQARKRRPRAHRGQDDSGRRWWPGEPGAGSPSVGSANSGASTAWKPIGIVAAVLAARLGAADPRGLDPASQVAG